MDESLLQQAAAARERGDYAAALRLLEGLAGAAAALMRGRVYADLNDLRSARREFNAASQADPAGPIGDAARQALLISLGPAAIALARPVEREPGTRLPGTRLPGTRLRVPARRRPNPWAARLVIALLVLSTLCALATIVTKGYDPARRRPAPTATPR